MNRAIVLFDCKYTTKYHACLKYNSSPHRVYLLKGAFIMRLYLLPLE